MKILPPNAFRNTAEYARPYFHAEVDNDCTLDDLLRPAFWGNHVANGTLKKNALIDIVRADGTLDVQLRCVEVGPAYAIMRPRMLWEDAEAAAARAAAAASLEAVNAQPIEELAPEGYKITYTPRGAEAGYGVLYVETDTKVAKSLKLKADAVKAAIEHAKKLGIYQPAAQSAPASEVA